MPPQRRPHPARPRAGSTLRSLAAGGLALGLGGCSIISPWPLWELAKAGGAATSMAVGSAKGTPSDTITRMNRPLQSVCIEYNPRAQVPDIVPALQTALRDNQVDSRVYESPAGLVRCPVWLRYTAYIEWEVPPFGSDYKPYINTAFLTLQTDTGAILGSSHYRIDSPFGRSKWASAHDKLAPVVVALLAQPKVAQVPAEPEPAPATPPSTPSQRPTRGRTP